MIYLAIANTIAIILLLLETMFYIDTEHKLRGCKFDPSEMYCYHELNCNEDSSKNSHA